MEFLPAFGCRRNTLYIIDLAKPLWPYFFDHADILWRRSDQWSNYTFSNTRYLGYAEIALGLADSFVENYALLFWVVGFGLFHIVYGIFFHLKYEKKNK